MPESPDKVEKAEPKGIFTFINGKRADILIILAIIILAFLIRINGIGDNGATWDETITVNAAVGYVNYLIHFVFSGPGWEINYEHPPVGKYIYGIAIWILNGGSLDISKINYQVIVYAKIASAIMGVATCILVYLIGREFFDRMIGLASALILAFVPVFLAHTQNAALESPLAFFFTLTMFLVMMAIKTRRAPYFIASAVSLGILLDVKFNAIMILPIILIFYILYKHDHISPGSRKNKRKVKGRSEAADDRGHIAGLVNEYFPPALVIAFCLIAIATWFILWPWIWSDTVSKLSLTLSHWTYDPHEYFQGVFIGQKPLYYYPLYFLVTTPLLLLIPLLVGIYMALTSKSSFKYAIVLWLAIPFAYGLSSFIQGGMRYIIMIYPAMAILCGVGLSAIAGYAGRLNMPDLAKKYAMPALTVLIVAYLAVSDLSVQPYYLDYYNGLAGGGQSIEDHRSFNIGWWGEGIYEAEKYVDSAAGPNTTTYVITWPADPTHRMYNLSSEFLQVDVMDQDTMRNISKYLDPDMPGSDHVIWGNENNSSWKPDYVITNYYMEANWNVTVDPSYYELVYASTVQGVPIVKVYKPVF